MTLADDSMKCRCGLGLHREPLYDARGIFCCYTCDKCEKEKRAEFRPDIFTNPSYETDEPIESDDY